jgi:integrase/recombinase XerC/integrase/recombinase XerD
MILANIQSTSAPILSNRLDELLDKFVGDLDIKQNSRNLYRRTLDIYFNWISDKGYSLSDVTRTELLQYKEHLLATRKSSLTTGSYITSLRRFYEWAEANKYYPNISRGVKTPKRLQEFKKMPLLPSQVTELLNYFSKKNLRDYAIISLLVRTGLRTIELTRADIGDITFKGSQRVLMVQGKGRDEKDNYVILTDKAYKVISDYLVTRVNAINTEPLFISYSNNNKGERLDTRTISYIAKEGLKAIGLNNKLFTAHSLRHTAIVNSRRGGATLEQAQTFARHSNPATTQIYDKIFRDEDRLKNSAELLLDNIY